MKFLFKLMMVLVCATMAVNAANPRIDSKDWEDGTFVKDRFSVNKRDIENSEGMMFDHNKSIDVNIVNECLTSKVDNINCYNCYPSCNRIFNNTRFLCGLGCVVGLGAATSLIVLECINGTCNFESNAMICAYVFGAVGITFGAYGCFGTKTQEQVN